MQENKYEKLDRMRADIARDREKIAKLQELIRQKEIKLKEAEASRIVADVSELNLTPEELGEFLTMIKSGKLDQFRSDATTYRPSLRTAVTEETNKETDEEENDDEDN